MTAILVVLTIAAFLTVEVLRERRHASRAVATHRIPAVAPDAFARVEGLFYGSGHTWARLETDGSVRVGIDDFARRLLGRVERVEAAPAGLALDRHDAAFVLHQGGKSAGFAPPVDGVVTAVNEDVLRDPAKVQHDPYGEGWLLQLRPKHLAENLRALRVGDEAGRWMREEAARLRDFLAASVPADAVGATLHDGGVPADGLMEHMDEKAWERFESEFLAS